MKENERKRKENKWNEKRKRKRKTKKGGQKEKRVQRGTQGLGFRCFFLVNKNKNKKKKQKKIRSSRPGLSRPGPK